MKGAFQGQAPRGCDRGRGGPTRRGVGYYGSRAEAPTRTASPRLADPFRTPMDRTHSRPTSRRATRPSGGRWGRRGVWAGILLGLAVGLSPVDAAGQEGPDACPLGTVERIEIRNHSLFRPTDIQDHDFRWALGFANWAHVRTRADYLRNELLVQEGDCYHPDRADEAARFLRELDFIARVEIRARDTGESGRALEVETWDEWSTQVGIDFDVENAFQFKGFYLREKNVLGRGLRLGFRYRDFRERQDRNLTLSTTRFLGTRADASLGAGTTRIGHYVRQAVSYPFQSEASRWAWQSELRAEDQEFSYLTGDLDGLSHVLLPLSDLAGRARLERRFGRPGALWILGGEANLLRRRADRDPRQVVLGDFDAAVPAADSLLGELTPHRSPDSYLEVGTTVGFRRFRFTTGQGLDRVTGVQNVALGSELSLTLGRSLHTFGTSSGYTWGRVVGFASGQAGPLLANTLLEGSGRRLDRPRGSESRWRDFSLRTRSRAYVQPGSTARHTTLATVDLRWRGHLDQPHQMALGGEGGVRSYQEDEVPVSSRLTASLEQQLNLTLFAPALDLGLTVFGDLGRGWAGSVPFAQDTGWRAAVGAGLRLGFPAGTDAVTRLELAWPVGGPDPGRGPVFRTYWAPALTSR